MTTLESNIGHYIQIDHTSYHYFAGNNYLGLANNPQLIEQGINALIHYGTNFSASRQTTGTADIHLKLEEKLSQFKGQEEAMVFASGYWGNKIVMDHLKHEISLVLTDSMAHSSLLDGIPRDIRTIECYEHMNTNKLERLLKKYRNKRALIATDGIFALTGEITPLNEIYALSEKYNALILVDDAHATGVLGENGRGTPQHFNLDGAPRIFQSETMSKALASYGGFISGKAAMIQSIRKSSAFYGASTSLPPALVACGCASLDYQGEHPELRQQLLANAHFLKSEISKLGFETNNSTTPVIPLFFSKKEDAQKLSDDLKEHQIIAPAVNYPVKMDKFIVRLTVSAAHTQDQFDYLINALKDWIAKYGIN